METLWGPQRALDFHFTENTTGVIAFQLIGVIVFQFDGATCGKLLLWHKKWWKIIFFYRFLHFLLTRKVSEVIGLLLRIFLFLKCLTFQGIMIVIIYLILVIIILVEAELVLSHNWNISHLLKWASKVLRHWWQSGMQLPSSFLLN